MWTKGLNVKDNNKEMFPVYGGKCFQPWWQNLADDEEVETEVRKWLRQQSETSMLRVSTHW
jgi:hypothetical protein